MSCPYYESKGSWSWGGGDYYCHKKQDYINSDMYYKYCRNYDYNDCPIYKASSSSGGCFLTSACVKSKGLPDDCYELKTLRNYRDGWLSDHEKGRVAIREYYNIAPDIVEKIDSASNGREIYQVIYDKMILPCIHFIEMNEMEKAFELYRKWTLKLEGCSRDDLECICL